MLKSITLAALLLCSPAIAAKVQQPDLNTLTHEPLLFCDSEESMLNIFNKQVEGSKADELLAQFTDCHYDPAAYFVVRAAVFEDKTFGSKKLLHVTLYKILIVASTDPALSVEKDYYTLAYYPNRLDGVPNGQEDQSY